MKHIIIKYKLGLIIALSIVSLHLYGQNYSERMEYEGHYKATDGTTLDVNNKYGDIHIINWDKDSVFITTELMLSSTSAERLRKLKKDVNVKYITSDNYITAYTSFNENTDQILNELQEFTKDIISNQIKRIEINYTIYVPKYISLKIKNQYGDIMMDNIYGHMEISLFNGALKANRLTGASSFEFKFAQASINQINDAYFDLVYSDLDVSKAISLETSSKISDIRILDVGVYKIHSTRDDINIDKVTYLHGQSAYSKVNISLLKKEVNCDMTYGKMDINKIDTDCSSIAIQSEHTDVSLYVPENLNINYDLTYHPDVFLHLPFETETTQPTDDTLLHIKKETDDTPSLDVKISAYKKCLIKIQKTL